MIATKIYPDNGVMANHVVGFSGVYLRNLKFSVITYPPMLERTRLPARSLLPYILHWQHKINVVSTNDPACAYGIKPSADTMQSLYTKLHFICIICIKCWHVSLVVHHAYIYIYSLWKFFYLLLVIAIYLKKNRFLYSSQEQYPNGQWSNFINEPHRCSS